MQVHKHRQVAVSRPLFTTLVYTLHRRDGKMLFEQVQLWLKSLERGERKQ